MGEKQRPPGKGGAFTERVQSFTSGASEEAGEKQGSARDQGSDLRQPRLLRC